ncbi:MAG: copper-binding protein [Gammaproteobacteria bacterium]|nr:MAG: copper-binding protein [Gammaproteobacteria bacterium]
MKKILWLGLIGFLSMGLTGASVAQEPPVSATGVVQQVKPEQQKVKIDHDPIPALGWPAMSMYFRVKDKTVLEGVSPGDKVRFEMKKDAKGLAITRIEKAAK